jgi:hypothetical protein
MKILPLFLNMVLSAALLAGCAGAATANVEFTPKPTPTTHILFDTLPTVDVLPVRGEVNRPGGSEVASTPSAMKTTVSSNSPEDTTAQPERKSREIVVYDERLHANWNVFSVDGMSFYLNSQVAAYTGNYSIEAKPNAPRSRLYFTVREGANEVYTREKVAGFSFWLYSGDEELSLHDLAVTGIGSNVYPYYQQGDLSAEKERPYEETFLVFLGFNKNIPPHTWVEVQVWLNDMLYDPEYEYFTGFYLTNRFVFNRTFLVDNVVITVIDEIISPTATPESVKVPVHVE